MTRAVLLAFLTLCCSRLSLAPAAHQKKVTCQPGKTTVVEIKTATTLTIQCPDNLKLTSPPTKAEPDKAAVFMDPHDPKSQPTPLCEAVPGATCSAPKAGSTDYVVQIAQLPRESIRVYFQCKAANQSIHDCYVGLEIAPAHRLGPNTCVAKKGRIDFSIEEQEESVLFACGPGKELRPGNKKKAFDDECKAEVDLPEGAERTETKGQYALKVQKLPVETIKICYVCVENNPPNVSDGCQVHVSISPPKKGGAPSLDVAARTGVALGLSLVAFSFLRVH